MKKLLFAFPIVALLAAGCNSLQQTYNQAPVQTAVTQNTNPTPAPSTTPSTSSDTSTWQTCQSTKYNYNFKYPIGWQVGVPAAGEMAISTCTNNNLQFADFATDVYSATDPNINFSVSPNEATSLIDYANKRAYTSLTPDHQWLQETKINGEQAFWYKETSYNVVSGYQIHVVTFHKGAAYEFYLKNVSASDPTVIQFFGNFKFLN